MTTRGAAAFDPLAMIRILNEHGVRFVVIGGIAAGVQGAIWATTDLDITYARGRDDHKRLAAALTALEAEPVDLPPDVRVHLDARSLAAGDVWTLTTRYGRLDLLGEPAPGIDYNFLARRARTIHGEQPVRERLQVAPECAAHEPSRPEHVAPAANL